MFIADQPCCRELEPWQRETIDDQARVHAAYWPL
jgi:hypothetical protein